MGMNNIKGGWVRDIGNGGPYGPKKNAHEKASGAESTVGWQNTQLNSVHIHLFRYADLLLMLAEADIEAGSMAEALTLVNQVRTRAAVTAQGCGEAGAPAQFASCTGHTELAGPINSPTITLATHCNANYPAFPDQAYARNPLRSH